MAFIKATNFDTIFVVFQLRLLQCVEEVRSDVWRMLTFVIFRQFHLPFFSHWILTKCKWCAFLLSATLFYNSEIIIRVFDFNNLSATHTVTELQLDQHDGFADNMIKDLSRLFYPLAGNGI